MLLRRYGRIPLQIQLPVPEIERDVDRDLYNV